MNSLMGLDTVASLSQFELLFKSLAISLKCLDDWWLLSKDIGGILSVKLPSKRASLASHWSVQ